MRLFVLFALLAGVIQGQPRVVKDVTIPPGKTEVIEVSLPGARLGEIYDILASSNRATVTIVGPDGSEVKADQGRDSGPILASVPVEDLHDAMNLARVLIAGKGRHWLMKLDENVAARTYKLRVDATKASAPVRVVIGTLLFHDLAKQFRSIPGARLLEAVKVPAGTRGAAVGFLVTAETGPYQVDVAPADPRTKIRLRLPDGTVVTEEDAKDHGVGWTRMQLGPEPNSDDFVSILMFALGMMLPVRGDHHNIYAGDTSPPGKYAIEAIAAGGQPTEISVLLIPTKKYQEAFANSVDTMDLPQDETRIIANNSYPVAYAGDKIPVSFRLVGAPVMPGMRIRTRAVLQRDSGTREEVDLPVDFVPGESGSYHGVVAPAVPGTYTIRAELEGQRKSGKPFQGAADLGTLDVRPLVARVKHLSERTLTKAGHTRPDRLEVTAEVEVYDPGLYQFAFRLRSEEVFPWRKTGKITLSRGIQRISVSFPAAALVGRYEKDGPYHASIELVRVSTSGKTDTADLRVGNDLVTAPYRLDSWEPIGAGVDLSGDGKFQIYRAHWDMVTPGGKCSWMEGLEPDRMREMSAETVARHAQLQPGAVTIESDFDGYWIARVPGAHIWHFNVWGLECDGHNIHDDEDFLWFKTDLLQAEDFAPRSVDFKIKLADPRARLRPGGTSGNIAVEVEPIGRLQGPVTMETISGPSFLKTNANVPGINTFTRYGNIYFSAAEGAKPGEYTVQLAAMAGGARHEVSVQVVVDVPPPEAPRPPPGPETAPPPTSSSRKVAIASKRRSVALVLGTNAGAARSGCEARKDIARQVTDKLQFGRDILSIIEFADSVNVTLPLTTNFGAALPQAMDHLSRAKCSGAANSAAALGRAAEQLMAEDLRNTERSVVLVIDGVPSAQDLLRNALRRLTDQGIRTVLLLIHPATDLIGVEDVLNLPAAHSYDPGKPSGALIVVRGRQDVPRAIERVMASIGGAGK